MINIISKVIRFCIPNLQYYNNKYFLFRNFVCFSLFAIILYFINFFFEGGITSLIVGFSIGFAISMTLFNWNSNKLIYRMGRIIIIFFGILFGFMICFYYFYLLDQSDSVYGIDSHKSIIRLTSTRGFKVLENKGIFLLNINTRYYSNGITKVLEDNNDLLNKDVNQILLEYGSYDNYLKQIKNEVNDDFMLNYYPDYIGDVKFVMLLNYLDPIIIKNVELIEKIYNQINNYNKLSEKLMNYSIYLSKDLSIVLVRELNTSRNELISLIKELGINNFDINDLLDKINSKVKNKE